MKKGKLTLVTVSLLTAFAALAGCSKDGGSEDGRRKRAGRR